MTTTLTKAIKEAGIAIPTNQRIWNWLKDNGEHTASEVSVGLKIPQSASSSIISSMVNRKMLKVNKKYSKYAGRPIGYYSAAGREFVLLPENKCPTAPITSIEGVPPVINKAPTTTQLKTSVDDILSNMSVFQAHEMYLKLCNIFNANKMVETGMVETRK